MSFVHANNNGTHTSDTCLTDAEPIYADASVIDGEGYTAHLFLVPTTMLCQMKYFRDHGTRCRSSSYTPTMLGSLLACKGNCTTRTPRPAFLCPPSPSWPGKDIFLRPTQQSCCFGVCIEGYEQTKGLPQAPHGIIADALTWAAAQQAGRRL